MRSRRLLTLLPMIATAAIAATVPSTLRAEAKAADADAAAASPVNWPQFRGPGGPSGERQPATAEDLVGDRERRVGRRDPGHGLVVPDRVGGQGVPHHGDRARHEAAVARRRLLQRVHRRDGEAGRLRGGVGEEDLRARHGDARPDHAQLSTRLRRSRELERRSGIASSTPAIRRSAAIARTASPRRRR